MERDGKSMRPWDRGDGYSGSVARWSWLDAPVVLGGGSIYERLRRDPRVKYDPHIKHGSLLYDEQFARVLSDVHREYMDVAVRAGLPMLLFTGTLRASAGRIARSRFADRDVNGDYVRFMRRLCCEVTPRHPFFVAGSLGPVGDAYCPEEALASGPAFEHHVGQAEAIAAAEPDAMVGVTLPALSEARGMAKAMELTGLPYFLSFVVRESGTLLDGTPLAAAMARIDQERERPPDGYMVNCVHPTVLDRALAANPPGTAERLVGLRANTSARSPEELDASEGLLGAEPETFAADVDASRVAHDLTYVGGCCGTNSAHMEAIAKKTCARDDTC